MPRDILQRAVAGNRLPTGYLFVGPANVGKTLTALELAKTINCESRAATVEASTVDCCDECETCRRIDRGTYPYLRVVFPMLKKQEELRKKHLKKQQEGAAVAAESDSADEHDQVFEQIELEGAEILIDPVRDMVRNANAKAPEGVWKLYVVQGAEKLRAEAANLLLKTLEEPPPRTTFILTTSRPADVLPTIVSRCQVIDFGPVPRPAALPALREGFSDIPDEEVEAIVAASAGRYGWAYQMLSRPALRTNRQALLKLLAGLPDRGLFEGMRLGEELVSLAESWFVDSYDPDTREAETTRALLKSNRDQVLRTVMAQLLDMALTWWRDIVLLISAPDSAEVLNRDYRAELVELAQLYGAQHCHRALRWIEEARSHFQGNANLRLTAELLMLKLVSLSPSKL